MIIACSFGSSNRTFINWLNDLILVEVNRLPGRNVFRSSFRRAVECSRQPGCVRPCVLDRGLIGRFVLHSGAG